MGLNILSIVLSDRWCLRDSLFSLHIIMYVVLVVWYFDWVWISIKFALNTGSAVRNAVQTLHNQTHFMHDQWEYYEKPWVDLYRFPSSTDENTAYSFNINQYCNEKNGRHLDGSRWKHKSKYIIQPDECLARSISTSRINNQNILRKMFAFQRPGDS